MFVQTSSGIQPVDFNKIMLKISSLTTGLSPILDPAVITKKTIERMVDGISTRELDELSAQVAANMVSLHPDYAILAARILMTRLHKNLDIPNRKFVDNLERIYNHQIGGRRSTRVSQPVMDFVRRNASELEKIIDYQRDFEDYDYFALQGFIRRGLERINGEIAEVPSQMFLRVAVGLNVFSGRDERDMEEFMKFSGFKPEFKRMAGMSDQERLDNIAEYYHILTKRELSLPGPIIMHAGSEKNQMASCFLEYCADSLTEEEYRVTGRVGGIMKALTQLAAQSKGGAGIAVAFQEIRSNGSPIRSSNGQSNGILPFMKMFDATIGAVNQSGKRAGVCAIYLEPWHADVLDFLDAANHFTIEERRCKNLFYALWMNDVFFERLVNDKQNAKWTLIDPAEATHILGKPLSEFYGEEFKEKYEYLESLGVGKTIPLMEVWGRVLHLFQTVGVPYILSKDSMNRKTNQQNLGVIKSSNICTEISLVANENETAVCVLSSLCLSRFYDETKPDKIDYNKIIQVARIATRHLNNVIDLQYYPTPETRNSCLSRRAIGIGACGLADLFHELKISFTSDKAKELNKKIYECIYFGCMWESMELAKIEGPYHGFEGSPVSRGILQYDMWGLSEADLFLSRDLDTAQISSEYGQTPWQTLKGLIAKYGVRNSEVTAIAPTANSSIRMAQNEMHEPFTRNMYVRQYIGGSIQVVNKYLVQELLELNLWNEGMLAKIVNADGSILNIEEIPDDIKERYRTVYEIDWRDLVDMMADRSAFVSQSGSFNHYTSYQEAGPTIFTQKILYAWRKGLKSLSYYMHTETATTAKKELAGLSETKSSQINDSIVDNLSSGPNPVSPLQMNITDKTAQNGVKILADGTICDRSNPDCEACSS
jgi:ribonucleoside-diphosphate reductase alpha chain